MNPVSDEIDLIELVVTLKALVLKYSWLLLTTILVGAVSGYFYNQNLKESFKSKMVVQSTIITPPVAKALIDDLELLIKTGNRTLLSKELALTEQEVDNVLNLSLKVPEFVSKSNNGLSLIEAHVTIKEIFPSLEKAILQYFASTPYYLNQKENERAFYTGLAQQVEIEINNLEKISKSNTGLKEIGNNIALEMLKKKQYYYLDSAKQVENIQVVKGFIVPEQVLKKSLVKYTVFGSLAGAFGGLCLLIFISLFQSPKPNKINS